MEDVGASPRFGYEEKNLAINTQIRDRGEDDSENVFTASPLIHQSGSLPMAYKLIEAMLDNDSSKRNDQQ